ncbi:MAG: PIN domain-containing protein [Candidatus Helarchaeota archaeon]
MKLVIDSNRLFAAFIKKSVSRAILLSNKFEFYAPFEILEEFKKYKDYLIKKSKISINTFENLHLSLFEPIYLVSLKKYEKELEDAIKIMQDIDIKDAPFLAIGLALNLDGIWSDDEHFLKQNEMKTYSTSNLLAILKK